jgi:leader peptidase (prepilin peptidase)/N-methyltransferase
MSSDRLSLVFVTVPLAGVVGLFVGSFLNVVIYRTPRGLSVAAPRSFCPACERQLNWWENVPLVSWTALRWRCRTCHQPISIRYPLVELATGATFASTTWAWHGTIISAAYCVLAASTIAVGLIEYGGQRAPLSVAVVGTTLALAIILVGGGWQQRWTTVVGSLVGTLLAVAAYALLRHRDPDSGDPRGHGRSALLMTGCWSGGLGLAATAAGVACWIVVYLFCMVGAWEHARQAVGVGGLSPDPGPDHGSPLVVAAPLITAVAAAMVVSLVVGT